MSNLITHSKFYVLVFLDVFKYFYLHDGFSQTFHLLTICLRYFQRIAINHSNLQQFISLLSRLYNVLVKCINNLHAENRVGIRIQNKEKFLNFV